jgi:hypothetical protein
MQYISQILKFIKRWNAGDYKQPKEYQQTNSQNYISIDASDSTFSIGFLKN